MSVAVNKTKTEQAFFDSFEKVAGSLPGDASVQAVREAALDTFFELGLPHRRIEEWKYTDLRAAMNDVLSPAVGGDARDIDANGVRQALGPLRDVDAYLVTFVDGAYRADLSEFDAAKGITVSSFSHRLSSGGVEGFDVTENSNAVRALNTAYASDGFVIEVEAGAVVDKPVLVANVRAGSDAGWTAMRNAIRVGDKADVTILEAFVGAQGSASTGQTNTATDVEIGSGAKLAHIKCVRESDGVSHLGTWNVTLQGCSTYRGFLFTQGIGLVRNDSNVTFVGEGGDLDLSGAFLARGREHVDNTMVVDHKVPGCVSRELFKGVLDDQARGIVQGKVIVRPDAQKTDGKQMAQALMLSPDTEFDSKPELEIYADDVVCGHGSTVAEIDHDLLFYCRSRGIPEAQARSLLVQSFVGEALETVGNEQIEKAFGVMVSSWLSERGAE